MNESIKDNSKHRNTLLAIGLYFFYLILTVCFYEVKYPNDENKFNCGYGYLIFGIPFLTLIITFLFSLIIFLINLGYKKAYLYLLVLLIPFSLWMYFYGGLIFDILYIFFDEK